MGLHRVAPTSSLPPHPDIHHVTQKRVSIEQLKPGMYIHDLGTDWMSHGFLRSRFTLRDDAQIGKIREAGIRELYIDASRGLDVEDAPTREEFDRMIDTDLHKVMAAPIPQKTSIREELGRAREIQARTRTVVKGMMSDVRMGASISLDAFEPLVEEMTESILRNGGALISLGALKDVDDYTFQHCVSVSTLMIALCRQLGLDADATREAGLGALLHDVGKMKTPLEVLNKPGKFTDEEFAIMKRHPEDGYAMLRETPGIGAVPLMITLHHHERIDGSGYPHRLAAQNIPYTAQMAAIVDVYDAISSDRCYHKGMPPPEAVRKIFEWSKFHFNPQLVQAFVRCIGIYPVGALVMLESERLAVVTQQNEANLLQPIVRVFYDARAMRPLFPEHVDLAKPLGHGGGDRIVGHEDPVDWGVNPMLHLA